MRNILNQTEERILDKFRGCIIGGAVGDALGYPVEFMGEEAIRCSYGDRGITEYRLTDGVAQISDDTQMTLFTANGLLLGVTRAMTRGVASSPQHYVALCYLDWFRTQTEDEPPKEPSDYSWLINLPQLFSNRAPGTTCIASLNRSKDNHRFGCVESPLNSSKGCGGVMRVAPVGIYYSGKHLDMKNTDMIAAECAAITHGHELGYIPAAALSHLIRLVIENDNIQLLSAAKDTVEAMKSLFEGYAYIDEFCELMDRAIELSSSDMPDIDAIHLLGEGWVAEEALAISLYCALKHENSFADAIIAAVNHKGDSDSTGAITGNILGAHLGLCAIPEKYLTHLELKEVILELADDLYHDCQDNYYSSFDDTPWLQKYGTKTYMMNKR